MLYICDSSQLPQHLSLQPNMYQQYPPGYGYPGAFPPNHPANFNHMVPPPPGPNYMHPHPPYPPGAPPNQNHRGPSTGAPKGPPSGQDPKAESQDQPPNENSKQAGKGSAPSYADVTKENKKNKPSRWSQDPKMTGM